MQPVQPVGGAANPSPVSADRAAAQPAANTPAPGAPAETARPVAAQAAPPRVQDDPNKQAKEATEAKAEARAKATADAASDAQSREPRESPMKAIVDILARQDGSAGPDPVLVPPVPMRYLSALLLQSAMEPRPGQVEAKS